MLWTLIRHELLANIMTFRFLVTVIACMSLVLAGSIVLTDNYERRLASYNTKKGTLTEKHIHHLCRISTELRTH